jgi:hypothetical protein
MPTVDGYDSGVDDAKLRTEMDAGPAKIRRRFTAVPEAMNVRLVMTATQLNAASPNGFMAFYVTDTSHGSAEFTWVNPRTGSVATCRFVGAPACRPLGGTAWEVTFRMEVMP